jgi:hypothetical protein
MTLRDMDSTDVAVLDEGDRACLDELGQYLVATDAWRRFAIWLLHKHFEPAAGEVFVESFSTAPRGTKTTLVERRGARGLNATSLRFDTEVSRGVGFIGMEFAAPSGFGATLALNGDDAPVLTGVAERLRAHGKAERFGVRLIRNPLGLVANQVLVETCDLAHRTLRCSVGARDDVDAGDTVETTWQWKPSLSGAGPQIQQYCTLMCGYDSTGSHYPEGHTIWPD